MKIASYNISGINDRRRSDPPAFLFSTEGERTLIALDARTGERCIGFADVNLRQGVQPLVEPREFTLTSPGTVVGDVIVVGSSVPDLIRANSPHGIVRAYDVRSGEVRWAFNTIPAQGDAGSDTWETGTVDTGAANVWSTIAAGGHDELGSPKGDYIVAWALPRAAHAR